MSDLIIIAVLVVIVGLAGRYVYKSKKSGRKCIGCLEGCSCSAGAQGSCSCGCGEGCNTTS